MKWVMTKDSVCSTRHQGHGDRELSFALNWGILEVSPMGWFITEEPAQSGECPGMPEG